MITFTRKMDVVVADKAYPVEIGSFDGYDVVKVAESDPSTPIAITSLSYHNQCSAPSIIVSQYFFELPAEVQEFIMYHELGHIKLGHIPEFSEIPEDQRTLQMSEEEAKQAFNEYAKTRLLGGIDQRELDADMFAAGCIGFTKCIDALSKLFRYTVIHARTLMNEGDESKKETVMLQVAQVKEFQARIRALKRECRRQAS